jgi:hypothetical protein
MQHLYTVMSVPEPGVGPVAPGGPVIVLYSLPGEQAPLTTSVTPIIFVRDLADWFKVRDKLVVS